MNFLNSALSNFMIHKISPYVSGQLFTYYLYIHPTGQAVIMRENEAKTEYLYADAGTSDKEWASRESLTYVTFDVLAKA